MRILALIAGVILVTACQPGEAPEEETAAYDGISPSETVTVVGNEPFWNGEITGDRMTWSTPENIDGETIGVSRFAGNNGLGFSGTLEGQPLQIAVTPGECSDGMSDRTFPFTVTVSLGDEQLSGCGYTDAQPYTGGEEVE